MRMASVCSGIGGAEVAFQGLAHCVWASEIEAFPRAVLAHRFPGLTIHRDFRDIETSEPIDVLVGGTPCQSFSVAGLRRGMADERGNLALEYLRLVDRLRPTWVVWENVPGVLSSNDGRDFGAFVGGLAECGYGWTYRVLDAQHFGLAQRRQRVFVVGCLGDWRRAAAVLFEPASLRGHPAPRREAGERVAPTLAGSSNGGGANGPGRDVDTAAVFASATVCPSVSSGPEMLPYWMTFDCREGSSSRGDGPNGAGFGEAGDPMFTLQTGAQHGVAFICSEQANGFALERDVAPTIHAHPQSDTSNIQQGVRIGSLVRLLTPTECERLQGLPENWTLIPWRGGMASDGPRYRAIGNGFAIPVVRWIARRLAREHAAMVADASEAAA